MAFVAVAAAVVEEVFPEITKKYFVDLLISSFCDGDAFCVSFSCDDLMKMMKTRKKQRSMRKKSKQFCVVVDVDVDADDFFSEKQRHRLDDHHHCSNCQKLLAQHLPLSISQESTFRDMLQKPTQLLSKHDLPFLEWIRQNLS